jgi:hypothetical protein
MSYGGWGSAPCGYTLVSVRSVFLPGRLDELSHLHLIVVGLAEPVEGEGEGGEEGGGGTPRL